jgi:bifunctional DNA-binding transcriptional regulator/antitoxin component of YhaV-PrlF toxin-antitoxin module
MPGKRNYRFVFKGSAPLASGGLTIPKPAREQVGLVDGSILLVFVDEELGVVLLTSSPSDEADSEKLIDLVTKAK